MHQTNILFVLVSIYYNYIIIYYLFYKSIMTINLLFVKLWKNTMNILLLHVMSYL